jgi:hypothetical protein
MENYNSKFKTAVIAIALVLIFIAGNSYGVIQAQNATPPAPNYGTTTAAPGENVVCQDVMGKFADVEMGRYRDFMTTNFQNKSSTSSLLDTAFARYKELRTALYNKYFTFFPQQGALQLTEGLEPGDCLKIVQDSLAEARRELGRRALQTGTVRKTTALVDKYQEINAQLRVLNRSFLTLKSYLDTFAQKLPCYIKKSCNKG